MPARKIRALSAQQIESEAKATTIIRAMLEGETLTSAADIAKVSVRQARRLLNKPENQASLRAGLQLMRTGAIETARARMEQLAPRAVEWLVEVGEGDDAHAKVKAAAQILDRNRGTQRGQVYSVGPAAQIDAMSDAELVAQAKRAAIILQNQPKNVLTEGEDKGTE